eukprot:TRINITY_DN14288_c0_g1_i1.p1 TRINITY_DN14288_c0_g1~~TRINITY_DN14288_c0_g1_i1.p1  ORF type:complete len:185 (+),score=47.95 TRINITY_DN14288_c0_g1_i1:182-736(+)
MSFYHRTAREISRATGEPVPTVLKPGKGFWRPVPDPEEGDWLTDYDEDGQTYKQYVEDASDCLSNEEENKKTIYLCAIGDAEDTLMEKLMTYTKIFFGAPTVLLPPVKISVEEVSSSVSTTQGRKRGSSSSSSSAATKYNMFMDIPLPANPKTKSKKKTTLSSSSSSTRSTRSTSSSSSSSSSS